MVEGTFATTTMDATDIGQYKYIFEVSSPTTETNDHKKVFWIASGNAAGTKLFLASGATSTMASAIAGTVAGYVRRVNLYDVFDGSSRTSNIGLPPEYTNGGSNYPYQWMVGNQTAFINELKNNFSGYPLKIVVSGATDNFISGTAQPGMQLWNMFPYDNAASQVVVQKGQYCI